MPLTMSLPSSNGSLVKTDTFTPDIAVPILLRVVTLNVTSVVVAQSKVLLTTRFVISFGLSSTMGSFF